MNCKVCGAEFSAPNCAPNKIFCSRSCSLKAWNEKRQTGQSKWAHTCKQCGKAYNAKNPDRDTFCSRGCCFAFKAAATDDWTHWWFCTCATCGERFISKGRKASVCSKRECYLERERSRARRKLEDSLPWITKTCEGCGSEYRVKYHAHRSRFCSRKCCRKEGHRATKARRKQKTQDHLRADKARFGLVWNKDGGRCHICGELCFKTFKVPHPLAPTLDHVIPLSAGGADTMSNARTAHFVCNSIKGASLHPEIYRDLARNAVAEARLGGNPWTYASAARLAEIRERGAETVGSLAT